MKFSFHIRNDFHLQRSTSGLTKLIQRWDWEKELSPEFARVHLAKRSTIQAQAYKNEMCYATMCGYYQAIIPILASMPPEDALQWFKDEADKLESELPFVILKYSKPKGEQK